MNGQNDYTEFRDKFSLLNRKHKTFKYLNRTYNQPYNKKSFLNTNYNKNYNYEDILQNINPFEYKKEQYNRINPFPGESFPKVAKTKFNKFSNAENECTVCLDKFSSNADIAVLPCFHYFHNECFLNWSMHNSQCPLCRTRIN